MTTAAITHPATTTTTTGFVAYEYTTIRAPRDLARLHEDTYRNFGWTVTDEHTVPGAVEFTLKRDRNIRTRSAVTELERKAQRSLTKIDRLNTSPRNFAMTSAMTIGLVGTAFLAGSVFTLLGGFIVASVALGVVGLLGWAGGAGAYIIVRNRRTAKLAAAIDAEYGTVNACAEQANRLLA